MALLNCIYPETVPFAHGRELKNCFKHCSINVKSFLFTNALSAFHNKRRLIMSNRHILSNFAVYNIYIQWTLCNINVKKMHCYLTENPKWFSSRKLILCNKRCFLFPIHWITIMQTMLIQEKSYCMFLTIMEINEKLNISKEFQT